MGPRSSGRSVENSELLEPPNEVVAAIAARQARGLADREKYAAAGAVQLLGDLRAGRAGADHKHGAVRKLLRVEVAAGVDLEQVRRVAQQVRQQRALIGTGGDDDIVGRDRAFRCFRDEAVRAVTRQPRHVHAATDRRRDKAGIGIDEVDDG